MNQNKVMSGSAWIDSIFEAQSICFGTEKAGLLDFSYNKCALGQIYISIIKCPKHI